MAGSDKVLVTAPQKPLTNECHPHSYPSNKKNRIYWNNESRATVVTHVSKEKDFEVVSHSNQVLLNFKAHQSNTSICELLTLLLQIPIIQQLHSVCGARHLRRAASLHPEKAVLQDVGICNIQYIVQFFTFQTQNSSRICCCMSTDSECS